MTRSRKRSGSACSSPVRLRRGRRFDRRHCRRPARRPACRSRSSGSRQDRRRSAVEQRSSARGLRLSGRTAGEAKARAARRRKQPRPAAKRRPCRPCVRDAGPRQIRRSPTRRPSRSQPPLPQQLIQNEAKARFDAAVRRRYRLCRAAGVVLVEPFLHFRRQDSSRWPAPMSAKRSARTCSAALPICCRRSKAIRPCCSISTTSSRWAPNSIAGINRDKGLNENLARETLELHTLGVRSRLHADRCHELRQSAHRLDLDQSGRARPRRRIRFQQTPARAGRADRARQALSRYRRRSGPRGARRSRAPSGDRAAHRAKARARISSPTSRRRRWSPSWRRRFRTATAISRKSPGRWSRPTNPGRRSGKSSKRPPNGSPA